VCDYYAVIAVLVRFSTL